MLSTPGDVDFFGDLNLPWVGLLLYRGEKFTDFLSCDDKLFQSLMISLACSFVMDEEVSKVERYSANAVTFP